MAPRTFFTADLHLGHAHILELCQRPFANVEAMDEALLQRWNAIVGEDDLVYVLGDVAMGSIEISLAKLGSLKGRKILIPGNHDRCSPEYPHRKQDWRAWRARYLEAGFEAIHDALRITCGECELMLSHYPYREEEDPHHGSAFLHSRLKDEGLPLVHGHVHGAWLQRRRMINAGVDVWDFRPVAMEVVLARLAGA